MLRSMLRWHFITSGSAELLLIESKGDIEHPPLEVKATTIPSGPDR